MSRRGIIWPVAAVSRALAAFALTLGFLAGGVQAQDSLIVKESPHSVADTLDRLAVAAEEKGLKVFSRVDHAAGAETAGLDLRPTQLLVIGNPKVGTPLMQADQRMALSLPLRIASWQDEDGSVWVGYWSPEVFAVQYGVSGQAERLKKMADALDGLTNAAIAE
ncbi:DUF302 domain-containing protein [Dichotomicrobium thermohalophilum]|uniref:Uncharacterized protein (DUF302 family) n=1 Tax=Dichotomicrobium thermohalophilum TaxID=933063 RepID=A0A397Q7L2_9HYPH|nr:DUF302 domain-containing protein [Dichotomicrobium thermohalophilum]RIA55497.1 uncharacterized protein (DUF302 family) [Dichotomicrobium thermohalophilum]